MAYTELKRTGPPGQEREAPPRPKAVEYRELWHLLTELSRLGVVCCCGWSLAFAVTWFGDTPAEPAPLPPTTITAVAPPAPPTRQDRPAGTAEPLVVVSANAVSAAD